MGSSRGVYSQEFRDSAAFVLVDGRSAAEVARSMGVHEMTVRKWVKKARQSGQNADPRRGLNSSEREELTRLRAENKELRLQVSFAKKVATWFAQDQQ